MADFETVKNKLRDTIVNNISELLTADKVFFATERYSMPEYPYIMITELSNNEDLGSGINKSSDGVLEVTEYKESVFTVAIYGHSQEDLTAERERIRAELKNIRNVFKLCQFNHSLKKYFTIQSMTDLRPLNTTTDTGYLYRYEFDITCGYNENISAQVELSNRVIINLEENNIHETIIKES